LLTKLLPYVVQAQLLTFKLFTGLLASSFRKSHMISPATFTNLGVEGEISSFLYHPAFAIEPQFIQTIPYRYYSCIFMYDKMHLHV
jgi:hypothetical protein